jgi:hypothetical protein
MFLIYKYITGYLTCFLYIEIRNNKCQYIRKRKLVFIFYNYFVNIHMLYVYDILFIHLT